MKIKDVMHQKILTVAPDTNIADTAKFMREHKIGCVVIKDISSYLGIITERDILIKVVAGGKNSHEVLAKDIMTTNLITMDEESTIQEAADLMSDKNIRRLLITRDGKITGIITIRETSKYIRYGSVTTLLQDGKDYSRETFS